MIETAHPAGLRDRAGGHLQGWPIAAAWRLARHLDQAEGSVTVVTAACRGYLPMDDLVDKKAETGPSLRRSWRAPRSSWPPREAKLQNEKFISKAPPERGATA